MKASSGMPCGDELRRRAEQGVAALDVGVEEGERLAGLEGLHPEADLAELDRHRVDVDAVEAAGDDVAERGSRRLGGGLVVAGADGGEALGDAVGGGDEEVARAAGGIDDLEVEERLLALLAAASSSTGSSAESRSTVIRLEGV